MLQAQTSFSFMSHGGKRKGAGRKRLQKHDASHAKRPRVNASIPFHVTLRFASEVPNLREERFVNEFTRAVERASTKGLNVNQFAIEPNHVHLMGETKNNETLTRGILSLQGSIKWALKRVFNFVGKVFEGRFHLHRLKTPREVRHALLYVIFNHAKHCGMEPFADAFSSAHAFRELHEYVRKPGRPPRWQHAIEKALRPAQSWLQTIGWKR